MYQSTVPKTIPKKAVFAPAVVIMGLLCGGNRSMKPVQAQAQAPPRTPLVRVAIFSEDSFPSYGFANFLAPPPLIARDLRAAGVQVDLVNADALARPEFDAKRYAALVMPYGNSYPQDAFANLRRFHQAGGSLILTGIPFTHPTARIAAQNWSATPSWGTNVERISGAGPTTKQAALQITGDADRMTGANSARFPVQPGETVSAAAQIRRVSIAGQGRRIAASRRPRTGASPSRRDELLVRFFDASGNFLSQQNVVFAPLEETWQKTEARATAPANAALADVSVQVQTPGRRYLAAEFYAAVNDKAVVLPNADLSQRDPTVWSDRGHTNEAAKWGANGIGVGGFAGPTPNLATVTISPGDPWHLKGIVPSSAKPNPAPQWIDTASLPKGVRLIPALGDAARPVAALIVHEKDAFAGAVDAWTLKGYSPDRDDYETRQIIVRATVAALAKKGVLQSQAALRGLDALPPPAVYANLTLPTVARTYPTLQPKMPPPARHLMVADVRKLSPDEKLLLISLQGLVNRTLPRIYLIFDDDDTLWLREMQKQGATDEPVMVIDPFTLLTTFKNDYKGAVLCDPKIYDSPCAAVAVAGADDLVIVKTPELAARFHLPITSDLRGKFQNNADALRWVRTALLPRLDPYLTCSLDPLRYDKGGLDQIIAARGSAFWVTGPRAQNLPGANQEAETDEVRKLMASLPMGAVVRGFWWDGDGMGMEEEAGVALGSRFGKMTIVSDLITNLSVHSGVPAENLTQKPRPPAPPLDKKVYLSFTMSDGDNLCTWRGYFRRYFDDPVRGSVPVGWGMGPTLIDLAPVWAKWYYAAATPNDEFICDVSGAAYLYPLEWGLNLQNRLAAFEHFYGLTQTYMGRMDMKTVRLMNTNTQSIAQVGTLLPNVEFLMPDYGHAGGETYNGLTYSLPTGQAVFRAVTNGSGPENLASQIRKRAGAARPAFVNAFIWNWGSSLGDLKKTMELLGPDYVAVLPSQLNTLYREANKAK